ncbi:MAG: type II toxin-antitoxin system RelE/ParE family toxin [Nitrospirae bacterium]|nr:type II toxin-antitoxin system RelE/ParE family toxin [Nitrospirota bacterium]
MFKIIFQSDALKSLRKLDRIIQDRIAEKINWLADNSDKIVHHPLISLPEDLKGLCRIRVGNYRIVYWVFHEERQILVYNIDHRSKVYKFSKN